MRALPLDQKTQDAIQFVHKCFSENENYSGTPHVIRMVMLIKPALELLHQASFNEDKETLERFLSSRIQIDIMCAFYAAFDEEANEKINTARDTRYREFLLSYEHTPENSPEYNLYKSLYKSPSDPIKKHSAQILKWLFSKLRLLDHTRDFSNEEMKDREVGILNYLDLIEKNFNRMLLTGSPVKCDYNKTEKEFFDIDRCARDHLLNFANNNPITCIRLTALADQVDFDTANKLSIFFKLPCDAIRSGILCCTRRYRDEPADNG